MVWEASPTLPFEKNMAYLSGEAPLQTSNVQQLSGAPTTTTEQGPSGETATTQTPQGASAPAQPLATSSYEGGGSIEEKLLNPLKAGLPEETANIQAMRQAFDTQAGPSRNWEGIGGQGIFEQALSTGDLTPAMDLLGASYAGPTGLGDDFANSDYELDILYGRANALQSAPGLMGYVQTVDPSMTTGKSRFTAKNLLQDELFKGQIPELYGQAKQAVDFAGTQEKEAVDFAKLRAKEEADIAKAAWDYGTSQKEALTSGLDQRIAETGYDEKRKAAEAAYQQMVEKGVLPTDLSVEGTKDIAQSDIAKGMTDADARYNKIMGYKNWQAAEKVPVLELTVTSHGKHYYKVPDAWAKSKEGKAMMAKGTWPIIFEAAIRRQQMLEKYFDPYTAQRKNLVQDGVWQPEGKYSKYMPLYYTGGQKFELSNPAAWTNFDPGLAPTRGNIASEDEITRYNRILDLLEQSGQLEDTGDYRDPSLSINADKYLADEAARLKQWDVETTKAGEKHFTDVHEARKGYREAKGGGFMNFQKAMLTQNWPAAINALQNNNLNEMLSHAGNYHGGDWLAMYNSQGYAKDAAKDLPEPGVPGVTPVGGSKTKKSILDQLQLLEQSGLLR